MTDNQLAVLLENIALNLENEINYLQELLPAELAAYREIPAEEDGKSPESEDEPAGGIPYFPCTELLWDFARKLREQAKSLENSSRS